VSPKKQKVDKARLAAAKVIQAVTFENAFRMKARRSTFRRLDLMRATSLLLPRLFTDSFVSAFDRLLRSASFFATFGGARPSVLTALRMGVWQLYFSYHVPPRAAVDESVKLVRFLSGERRRVLSMRSCES